MTSNQNRNGSDQENESSGTETESPKIFRDNKNEAMVFSVKIDVPGRGKLQKTIEQHGGKVLKRDVNANALNANVYVLSDPTKANLHGDQYDYRYIYDSVDAGIKKDILEYKLITKSPKTGRAHFTKEEDNALSEYLIQKRSEGASLMGNILYKDFVTIHGDDRHTWQSFRERAKKHIIPNLPAQEQSLVESDEETIRDNMSPFVQTPSKRSKVSNKSTTPIQSQNSGSSTVESSPEKSSHSQEQTPRNNLEIVFFPGQDANSPSRLSNRTQSRSQDRASAKAQLSSASSQRFVRSHVETPLRDTQSVDTSATATRTRGRNLFVNNTTTAEENDYEDDDAATRSFLDSYAGRSPDSTTTKNFFNQSFTQTPNILSSPTNDQITPTPNLRSRMMSETSASQREIRNSYKSSPLNNNPQEEITADQAAFLQEVSDVAKKFSKTQEEVVLMLYKVSNSYAMAENFFRNGKTAENEKHIWEPSEDEIILNSTDQQKLEELSNKHGDKLFNERVRYLNEFYCNDNYEEFL